eukprot:TRINITY_DN6396_c0_g1_i2.p2 TRINITY_DN6396_c0_g1~~TRINITY_DN6396_c0_g1_i2.p2  ORF type:complete len:113 (-),score=25.44 TRINITY_DN6396_c0_g1_i2:52-390(-)
MILHHRAFPQFIQQNLREILLGERSDLLSTMAIVNTKKGLLVFSKLIHDGVFVFHPPSMLRILIRRYCHTFDCNPRLTFIFKSGCSPMFDPSSPLFDLSPPSSLGFPSQLSS